MLSVLKRRIRKDLAVEIELGGEIYEDKEKVSIPFLKNKEKTTIFDLENLFQYLKNIPVKAVLISIGNLNTGLARANSIRNNIKQLSILGIETCVYLENGGNTEYFIASAADRIYMPEWSTLNLIGLSSDTFFLKDFFSKLHIEPEIEGKGNYKSAAELFSRNGMSEYSREMINSLIDQNYSLIKKGISESRNIEPGLLEKLIDDGPYLSGRALDKGLIDRIGYYQNVKDDILQKLGKDLVFLDYKKLLKSINQKNRLKSIYYRVLGKKNVIAVITVEGMITEGESKRGGSRLKTCGASTIINNLKNAEKNPAVGAIIIRVLSPGGSALASDLLRSEISRIRDKKPVVISMSDVAASGGYMLALSANRIFADEFTLTGSIGVVSGKFNFSKLLKYLNINHESVSRGKNASIYSSLKKFTPEEKKIFSRMMDKMYENFTALVSKSRNLDMESVENAAQGRVWTGVQAKELGIIDETAGLTKAIDHAKELAGVESSAAPVFKFYRTRIDLGEIGKSLTLSSEIPGEIADLFSGRKALALMPFYIRFK